ncbi:hypothetical protein TNCV_2802811 [Trichonephila clavipes]|nr:hypothetical protein TNCV_2802811 [Trichonephila clavipes]
MHKEAISSSTRPKFVGVVHVITVPCDESVRNLSTNLLRRLSLGNINSRLFPINSKKKYGIFKLDKEVERRPLRPSSSTVLHSLTEHATPATNQLTNMNSSPQTACRRPWMTDTHVPIHDG